MTLDRDIVARFLQLMLESLRDYQPGFEGAMAAEMEKTMRQEYGGEAVHVRKAALRGEELREEIRRRWNGRNAEELAKEMEVSLSTIYRAIRYRRVP